MKSRLIVYVCAILLIALTPSGAGAQTKCADTDSIQKCLCGDELLMQAKYFTDVREQAIAVRELFCKGADPADVVAEFESLIENNQGKWFAPFGGFASLVPLEEVIISRKSFSDSPYPRYPNMVARANQKGILVLGNGISIEPSDVSMCPNGQCTSVLREFAAFYNHAQSTISAERAGEFWQYIIKTKTRWEKFFDVSRSMTPLELALNSWAFDKNSSLGFNGPPEFQYIFLHPSPVIENFSASPDGQNVKEALMIEIVGANAWQWDKWYSPSGGSVIAVLADRANEEDVGYGLALHFGPKYSFGAVHRDGETGLVFSIDFLKFVEDKKEVLDVLAQRKLKP